MSFFVLLCMFCNLICVFYNTYWVLLVAFFKPGKVIIVMHCHLKAVWYVPVILGCFWSSLYCTCAKTAISDFPVKILTSPFQRHQFPKIWHNSGDQTTFPSVFFPCTGGISVTFLFPVNVTEWPSSHVSHFVFHTGMILPIWSPSLYPSVTACPTFEAFIWTNGIL